MEDGTRRLIHGWVKQTQFCVDFYRSVVTNREFSNTVKVLVVTSVNVPILTCCHQSWVMTESVLSKVQTAEESFYRRIHRMTLRDNVCSSEISKTFNADQHLRIEGSQLR